MSVPSNCLPMCATICWGYLFIIIGEMFQKGPHIGKFLDYLLQSESFILASLFLIIPINYAFKLCSLLLSNIWLTTASSVFQSLVHISSYLMRFDTSWQYLKCGHYLYLISCRISWPGVHKYVLFHQIIDLEQHN